MIPAHGSLVPQAHLRIGSAGEPFQGPPAVGFSPNLGWHWGLWHVWRPSSPHGSLPVTRHSLEPPGRHLQGLVCLRMGRPHCEPVHASEKPLPLPENIPFPPQAT